MVSQFDLAVLADARASYLRLRALIQERVDEGEDVEPGELELEELVKA